MKKTFFLFSILLFALRLPGQDAQLFKYQYYGGSPALNLNLGEIKYVNTDDDDISIKILNPNVAIKATRVDGSNNDYPEGAVERFLLFTDQNMPFVGGTSQYQNVNLRVECVPKENLPQPTSWVPVDRNNVNSEIAEGYTIGERVLMLRRAYIWENAEDVSCCHGPYGSVTLMVYPSNLLTDYGFNFPAIAEVYCENFCSLAPTCQSFLANYPVINNGFRLAGPVYNADNPCNDFGSNCLGIPSDPKSEWADGPWGVCYSRIPVFKWGNLPDQVSLVLREGDETNCDDFMAGILIDKNNSNTIVFRAWNFGWIELQNITITQADIDNNVDVADYYWNHSWNGNNPEHIHSIPQTPPYDQFVPLAGHSISEMESIFPTGSIIGLLGGKFPTGTLSKPMIYKAACQPAVFGQ